VRRLGRHQFVVLGLVIAFAVSACTEDSGGTTTAPSEGTATTEDTGTTAAPGSTAAPGTTTAGSDEGLSIIFTVHAGSANAFFQSVKNGMDDACELVDADCQMIFAPTDGDVPGLVSNFQAAIAQSPDMIITAIPDNDALDEVVQEAVDAGITVIASNVDDLEGADGNARHAFVGQDFVTAGGVLARSLSAQFPESGPIKVLIGVNAPDNNWSRARADGVIAGLEEWQAANPDRDITWDEIDAGFDYAITGDRFGNYLTANPDLNVYFDTGFWDYAARNVLVDRGIDPGGILLGGFDLVPDVLTAMQEGYIQITVDQQPYLQGYAPVMQAPLIKYYKMAPFDVDTGNAVVTPDQVEDIIQLAQDGYR
jgi:simple sugar transport system substrate-binding protein